MYFLFLLIFFITFSPRLIYCKNKAYNTYTEYVLTVYVISKASADWRPLVVKFEGSQQLYTDFQLHRWLGSSACIVAGPTVSLYIHPPAASSITRLQFLPSNVQTTVLSEIKRSWLSLEALCLSWLVISIKTSNLAMSLAIPWAILFLQTDRTSNYIPSMVFKTGENV